MATSTNTTPAPAPSSAGQEMTAAMILFNARLGFIMVNTEIDEAIAAHRVAFAQAQQSGDIEDHRAAGNALRAVVLATPRSRPELELQFSYLSEQPIEAWTYPMSDKTPAALRTATLAMVRADLEAGAAA